MQELQKLKLRLSSHKRKLREYPADTETEQKVGELEARLIQLQIEAEELRTSLRLSLPFCESYTANTEAGRVYKFTFGWEVVRDSYLKAIADNERLMTDKINAKIKALYEQPATTGAN